MTSTGTIRIGVGGWTFQAWRGGFYPAGLPHARELDYMSRKLTSIEINGTFYGAQKPASFQRWHDETPDDFVFAVKGPRYATNRRELATAGESIERFFTGGVMLLRSKLGPVNWQLAPHKKFDAADMEGFLKLLPASVDGRGVRHALEVRHASFADPAFVALARARGVAIVVAGDSRYPEIADPTAPFVYARIMGTAEDEPAGYAHGALTAWSERARAWATGGRVEGLAEVGEGATDGVPRDVFLYVISGHKPANPAAAMALIEGLARVMLDPADRRDRGAD